MKKIILILSLVSLCLTGFTQSEEFVRIYTEWRVLDGETFEVEKSNFEITIVTFNPGGKNMIEIKREGSDPFYLFQVGDVDDDTDDNGKAVQTIKAVNEEGLDVMFSFFEDDKKGVLLVFEDYDGVRLVNFCN